MQIRYYGQNRTKVVSIYTLKVALNWKNINITLSDKFKALQVKLQNSIVFSQFEYYEKVSQKYLTQIY